MSEMLSCCRLLDYSVDHGGVCDMVDGRSGGGVIIPYNCLLIGYTDIRILPRNVVIDSGIQGATSGGLAPIDARCAAVERPIGMVGRLLLFQLSP